MEEANIQEEEGEHYYPTPPKFTPQDETDIFIPRFVHFRLKVPKDGMTEEFQHYLDSLAYNGISYTLCDESKDDAALVRILADVMYRRSSSDERRIMLGMIDETKPVETEETAVEETTTK